VTATVLDRPYIVLIAAAAENGVIGRDNTIPWRLKSDQQRLKAITLNKPIVMGRKTFDSIGRPLPGRLNIVISRQPGRDIPGCRVVTSIDEAIAAAQPAPEIVVVGGAEIYRQVLPRVQIIHLTRVHADVPGDVVFPTLRDEEWREVATEYHPADERHAHAFTFSTLERVAP
jgi:dihydrofolate reductase